jgi:methyl-accepting chemotaxis protein
VTQQNAALVEESAAAAESLRHQAATLAEVVSVFKVAQHGTMAPAAARAAKAADAPHAKQHTPERAKHPTPPAPKAKPPAKQPEPATVAANSGTDEWDTF